MIEFNKLIGFEFTIAIRYLRSRKGFISFVTSFSLLGIALGVAALIVVMAVMGGFHSQISSKMTGWGGDIDIYNYNHSLSDYNKIIEDISDSPKVILAYPVINGQVMINTKHSSGGAIVKAMRLEDISKKHIIMDNIISGSIDEFSDNNIIIGSDLAYSLNIHVNDEINLISAKGISTVIGFIPRMKNFKIVGIFKSGMYQYDNTTIIMPLNIAQKYFKLGDSVNNIEVAIKDPYQSEKTVKSIKNKLGYDYIIEDWQITNASFFNVLKTERIVMFSILTLIIIVASFNIVSSLTMLVRDKNRDIAILRTMGSSKLEIMRIFIICGTLIGLAGTSIGVIMGLGFALNIERIRKFLENITEIKIFDPVIYYLSSLPAEVKMEDVLAIASMSIILSLISTFYPAYSASKISPADGLRNE